MPDSVTPNTISGAVILSLMDAMCQERDNISPIEAIKAYLWELYEKSEYPTIADVLQVLYLLHEIAVPVILDALLQYGDTHLLAVANEVNGHAILKLSIWIEYLTFSYYPNFLYFNEVSGTRN